MAAVIIGIHGLGNKPPLKKLKRWWIQSIREGFMAYGYPLYFFKFELCFWADIVHPELLNPNNDSKKDPLAEQEPYIRASSYDVKEPSLVRRKMLDFLEKKMDNAFAGSKLSHRLELLSEAFIHNFFRDLEIYFSDQRTQKSANSLIKDRLIEVLQRHKKDRIVLIAHSMGSIVAYDVLVHFFKELHVDTLITIGSPLGLPFIMNKFTPVDQKSSDKVPILKTPDAVQKDWFNLTDLNDKVTVNYNWADDYSKNSNGIGVTDLIVSNNYEYKGHKNHHKVFGYLRTPEMANILYEFIDQDRNALQKGINSVVYHGWKMLRNNRK